MLTAHFRHTAVRRNLVAICCALLALPAVAAEPAPHIVISAQQIAQAGIKTAPVVAAATGAAGASAGGQGLRLSGTVVAPAGAVSIVSAQVSGVVQAIHVDSLRQVAAGTPLVTLFSAQLMEMQREYLQLATQSQLAQQRLVRDEALATEGIIAASRLQETRGAAVQAEVAASERRQALRAAGLSEAALASMLRSKTLTPGLTLHAGRSGTLLEMSAQIGQRVEAGAPLARIGRDGALWIEFQAARQQADQIRVGDLLELKQCGTAKVLALSPQMDGGNQTTLIRAQQSAHDDCLKVNQFVEASHVGRQVTAGSFGVPAAAVVRQGGQQFVFLRGAKGFDAIKVRVVPGTPERVWVEGALRVGGEVATSGIVALKGAWMGLGAEAAPAGPAANSGGK